MREVANGQIELCKNLIQQEINNKAVHLQRLASNDFVMTQIIIEEISQLCILIKIPLPKSVAHIKNLLEWPLREKSINIQAQQLIFQPTNKYQIFNKLEQMQKCLDVYHKYRFFLQTEELKIKNILTNLTSYLLFYSVLPKVKECLHLSDLISARKIFNPAHDLLKNISNWKNLKHLDL